MELAQLIRRCCFGKSFILCNLANGAFAPAGKESHYIHSPETPYGLMTSYEYNHGYKNNGSLGNPSFPDSRIRSWKKCVNQRVLILG